MSMMFLSCYGLSSLDISNFDTSQVQSTDRMFEGCRSLVILKQKFTLEKLIKCPDMFKNCEKLNSLHLSGLVGEFLAEASNMFYNCNSLTSIDLSNFEGKKVKDHSIFYNMPLEITLKYNFTKIDSKIKSWFGDYWKLIDVSTS